jgi:tripartite-type tricarboxylate transporter receptor subunit TctC
MLPNFYAGRPAACAATLAIAATLASITQITAQPVADFYKGKTLNVLIGVSAGGEYDLHARIVARHIGKHIPGNPSVVPQNMTGAAGVTMTNYLYNVAAKDGTYIGMIQNGMPIAQVLGTPNLKFDTGQFQWIGSISPTVETLALWHTAGAKTLEEARQKEISIGTTGRGTITTTFPRLFNEFAGTKFKIISGYPGGNDINLAMQRGEVGGRNNTWSSWKATKRDWLANKEIVIIGYAGPQPKDLPGIPNLEALAKNDDDRRIISLLISGTKLGRPLAAMPGVPVDRVDAIRKAFMATMSDPEFRKDTTTANIEVDPVPGETMQKVVADVLSTPKPLVDRAKPLND